MDSREPARRLDERGVSSLQFLIASGLGLVLFLLLANLVVVQYGRGAVRSALDQGARVAAVTGSAAGCEDRIVEVLEQLLGGKMGDEVSAFCRVEDVLVTAEATGEFASWTPFTPDVGFSMTASATAEAP